MVGHDDNEGAFELTRPGCTQEHVAGWVFSQEALAVQAGINRSYVGQIKRGIGNPSLQVLVKLVTTLQMDVADLLKRGRDDKRR